MPIDLGFCAHDAIAYPSQASAEMAAVKAIGGRKVRIGMWWALVEPVKGHYTGYPAAPDGLPRGFEQVDVAVNAALAQGLDVLLLLNNPVPGWASTRSATEYGQFCAQAARRYRPGGSAITPANAGKGVVRYELLNEVNVGNFWSMGGWWGIGRGVVVSQIAAFHKAAYAAIKGVQPLAEVGGWAMAAVVDWPNGWGAAGPAQVAPASFVKQMIEAGCGPVDFITYHSYTLANDFTTFQPPTATHPFIQQIVAIRNVLNIKGINVPMDMTEWGYSTADFSEQQQADFLGRLWTILHNSTYGPLIRDHYVYCAKDFRLPSEAWSPTNREHNYGVHHQDLTPKPAATFFRSLP